LKTGDPEGSVGSNPTPSDFVENQALTKQIISKKANSIIDSITAEEFDRKFDAGEDISQYLDWESARRPGLESKRINIDLPNDFLAALDKEADRRGITRQSLIKVWLYDQLQNSGAIEGIRILDRFKWASPKERKSMRQSVIKLLTSEELVRNLVAQVPIDLKGEPQVLPKVRSPKHRHPGKKVPN
jgi:CopG antitoxin of type II toxin-antitoxin system